MAQQPETGEVFRRRPGLAHKLHHLTDVSASNPVAGEALVYQADGLWSPQLIDPTPGTNSITNAMLQDNIIGNAEMQDNAVNTAELVDGAVTDGKIGNRTVDQSIATAFSNTGALTTLLSFIAKVLKSFSGKTNWYDTPDTTLATAATHIASTSNPHAVTISQIGITQQQAQPSSGLTLNNTYSDVPGMTLTIAAAGTYLVNVSLDVLIFAASGVCTFSLVVNGTASDEVRLAIDTGSSIRHPVGWSQIITTTGANQIVKVQGKATTAGQGSAISSQASWLTAVRVA